MLNKLYQLKENPESHIFSSAHTAGLLSALQDLHILLQWECMVVVFAAYLKFLSSAGTTLHIMARIKCQAV